MSGNSKQDKDKKARRASDMNLHVVEVRPGWAPPPPEECYDAPIAPFVPPDGDAAIDRIRIRMTMATLDDLMVDFALIQETYYQGKWRPVAKADSAHDDEVHIHWYSRRTGTEIGQREHIVPIMCREDLEEGYDRATEWVVADWARNKQRWHDA
jgi:hypothetical protein